MRLLALTRYPVEAAGTRFRVAALEPALAAEGVALDLRSFLSAAEFRSLYQPGAGARRVASAGRGLLRRLVTLARSGRYAGVLVQREAIPFGPPALEAALRYLRGLPLVYDFDDAVWLTRTGGDGVAARLLGTLRSGRKAELLMRASSLVMAGSEYLAAHARTYAGVVEAVPSVVSARQWAPLPCRQSGAFAGRVPVIGWIGTHSTSYQLRLVEPALERLRARGREFRVVVVGAENGYTMRRVDAEYVRWSKEDEVRRFREIDVGLAPMFDDEWGKGKCGFKQLQYMAVGVPMVTSLVGGARDFVEDERNALVASEDADAWTVAIERLLDDVSLRQRLSRRAREQVETTYSSEVLMPKTARSIARVMRDGGRRHA